MRYSAGQHRRDSLSTEIQDKKLTRHMSHSDRENVIPNQSIYDPHFNAFHTIPIIPTV